MILEYLVYIGFTLSFGGIFTTLFLCMLTKDTNKWIMVSTFFTLIGVICFFGGIALLST